VNTAQTWTLVAGTLGVQAAVLGIVLSTQTRWIKAEFGRVVDRIDKLDRDVHAVIVRMMGPDS
jgi:hypothetical protein